MKSDRLIALLMALQHAGKEPATALAGRLEVSVRTIYRDVDALSAAGIPVYAERGSQGGIVLADTYRDALGRFGDDELRALFVSSGDALADIGLRGDHRSALDKLARAMPQRARDTVGQTRGRVHVDARRWVAPASSPSGTLVALRDAVWSDRSVTIGYTARSGAVTRRSVDPFGLVTKAGIWYLVARDGETMKTFRVQRISRVRVLDRRFTRPAGFDLETYWKGVAAFVGSEDVPYVATFRMNRGALANASVFYTIESRRRVRGSTPAEWIVRIAFPVFAAALQEALGWDEGAVALEPPGLCAAITERARSLLARYAS
jgi:predicted DNA-binding transcriptional regulator YafY